MKTIVQQSYSWLLALAWAVIVLGVVVIFVELAVADCVRRCDLYDMKDCPYYMTECVESKEQETLEEIRDLEKVQTGLMLLETQPSVSPDPVTRSVDRAIRIIEFEQLLGKID